MSERIVQRIMEATLLQLKIQPEVSENDLTSQLEDGSDASRPALLVVALNECAKPHHVTFLGKQLSASDVEELLDNPLLPLLVFQHTPSRAVLVTGERSGTLVGLRFDPEADQEVTFGSAAELVQTLQETEGIITVYSPLVMKPLVSGRTVTGAKLTPVRRLWRLLAGEKRDIAYIYVYAIMSGLLGMSLPLGVQSIVGQVSGGMILEPAVLLIVLVILGTLLSGLLQIMQLGIVETIQQRLFTKAAFEFSYRLPRLKLEALSRYYAPELVNRFFDILTVQKGIQKLLNDFISALLMILFGMVLLSLYHPLFVIFGIVMVAILVLIFRFTGPWGLATSLQESKFKYKVAGWLQEVARSMITFKMGGATQLNLEKTDQLVGHYIDVRRKHFNVLRIQFGSMVVFKTLVTGALLIMGSLLVVDRQISLGQFVAAEIVILTIINGVEKVYLSLDTVYDLLTAVEKLGNVTDLPLERTDGELLSAKDKGMEVKTVDFSFMHVGDTANTLQRINLHVRSGERIGICGESGSGKSTLLKALAGLYQDYQGGLSYDGVSLRDLNPMILRNHIGDNLNYEEIFEGTLLDNITLGRKGITLERVQAALANAGLADWVQSLHDGLRTRLLPRGDQLSSGRARRIILARMLVGNPRLLIVDNLNATFDREFQQKLMGFLCSPGNKATIIAASNDAEFLSRMDRVYSLDQEGRLLPHHHTLKGTQDQHA